MTSEEPIVCMQHADGEGKCAGHVEYRMALSGTGISYPRCDKHWEERVEIQQGIDQRYPVLPPADFDPLYAGEAWDEEDY